MAVPDFLFWFSHPLFVPQTFTNCRPHVLLRPPEPSRPTSFFSFPLLLRPPFLLDYFGPPTPPTTFPQMVPLPSPFLEFPVFSHVVTTPFRVVYSPDFPPINNFLGFCFSGCYGGYALALWLRFFFSFPRIWSLFPLLFYNLSSCPFNLPYGHTLSLALKFFFFSPPPDDLLDWPTCFTLSPQRGCLAALTSLLSRSTHWVSLSLSCQPPPSLQFPPFFFSAFYVLFFLRWSHLCCNVVFFSLFLSQLRALRVLVSVPFSFVFSRVRFF